MVSLTYRAERALLGALLRDPASLLDIPFLTAGDFASEQHGEVFSAIAAAHGAELRAVTQAAGGLRIEVWFPPGPDRLARTGRAERTEVLV